MNGKGDAVDNESLALGRPVSVNWTCSHNVFVMDESSSNAHGKDDSLKGGEKKVVPAGEIPREEVGIHDAHFTVLPIHNLEAELVFVTVIFKGEKVQPLWALGVDVWAELSEDCHPGNFGPGRRFPGLSLFRKDGTEIPVLFAASPNASMTSAILTATFRAMD